MNGLLVIFDNETVYDLRLADYISRYLSEAYDIRVCSSVNSLSKITIDHEIEYLIIGSECTYELNNSEKINHRSIKNIVVLSSDRELEGLYKYQSAEEIVKAVISTKSEAYSGTNSISATCEKDPKVHNNTHMSSKYAKISSEFSEMKRTITKSVQDKLLEYGESSDEQTLKVIDRLIELNDCEMSEPEKSRLRNEVFFSIRGLGVLEELIADESISEIMVNGENNIFYERKGRLIDSGKHFDSREQLLDIIQKIVSNAGRSVNMANPIVDARLSDGSRVNVVLEPVSLSGPVLTIRRFPKSPLSAEKLCTLGAVSEDMLDLLRKLVYAGYNILISGGTGAGKTTLMNMLTGFIPGDERIITIEDSAELRVTGISNLVSLETRNSGSDGLEEITIRDLIRTALRMRPDRIIVGEVRGPEAIDMIQAFSVGEDGSMSTIHANNAEDALYRLEMLMLLGKLDMPLSAIRRQIAIGVDIIIQLGRLKDKSRKVLEIREVLSMKGDTIETGLLYRYENGRFVKHGDIVNTYKLEKAGCL